MPEVIDMHEAAKTAANTAPVRVGPINGEFYQVGYMPHLYFQSLWPHIAGIGVAFAGVAAGTTDASQIAMQIMAVPQAQLLLAAGCTFHEDDDDEATAYTAYMNKVSRMDFVDIAELATAAVKLNFTGERVLKLAAFLNAAVEAAQAMLPESQKPAASNSAAAPANRAARRATSSGKR